MGEALKFAARASSDIDTPPAGQVARFRDADGVWRTKDSTGTVDYERHRMQSLEKVGYESSVRGTATQSASKTTTVVMNALMGTITLASGALAADAAATFTLTNSEIAADDQITVTHHSGGTLGAYVVTGRASGKGTGSITIRNVTTGSLNETPVLKVKVEAA